jgi:hypothetical protein
VRSTLAHRRRLDNRFFCEDVPYDYKVKDGIITFMEQLEKADRLKGKPKSEIFVNRIVDLIGKMLAPNAVNRIDIGEVIRSLRFAIEDSNDTTQPLEMTPVPGERSILEPDLGSIKYVLPQLMCGTIFERSCAYCSYPSLWHWRSRRWSQATLRVFEDNHGNLRVCTSANHDLTEDHLFRSRVQLIPQYAFTETFLPHVSEEAIYFADVDAKGVPKYPGSIFSFSDIKGMFVAHLSCPISD